MMKTRLFAAILLLALSAPLSAEDSTTPSSPPVASGSVSVERPWIKAGEDESIMLAGFAALKSNASERWILQQATAKYFRMVMIHRTVLQDGEPRMVLQNTLTVRPGETVEMSNQGYHLMFIGPTRKYKEGDKINVVLNFKNQPPLKVEFPVLAKAPQ